jgi:hypothetical protein
LTGVGLAVYSGSGISFYTVGLEVARPANLSL